MCINLAQRFMKKLVIVIFLLLCGLSGWSQNDRLITRSGHVWFFSHAPLEDIEAHSKQVAAILATSSGMLAIELPIVTFQFKKRLMQEHFNENYMESSKFPKGIFRGAITNFQLVNMNKDGAYPAIAEGVLEIRGVKKNVKVEGSAIVKGGKLTLKGKFNINLKDFNIKVEKHLEKNIASTVAVNVDIEFPKK